MIENVLETQVVIIGAGPSGTVCGYLLKKAGIDCVVVDHATFPRDKICGGGLTVKAYRLLAELMPDLHYEYKSIRKVRLSIDHETVCEFEPTEELRIVRRKVFDHTLLKQYLQIGGTFEHEAFAKFETQSDGRLLVTMKSGRQILCRYLVGADGANSQVRKQAIGDYKGRTLWLEQYSEKSSDILEVELSAKYDQGYYYVFPNPDYDVIGIGDKDMSMERFRKVLNERGIQETKIKGAYIPIEDVESGDDHVILIGDAGGFPNKLTYEGLYYAIATARNAFVAIKEDKPFKEVNRIIFKKKSHETYWVKLFYSPLGLWITRTFSHYPKLVQFIYDHGVR